jgi:hypothetical protein
MIEENRMLFGGRESKDDPVREYFKAMPEPHRIKEAVHEFETRKRLDQGGMTPRLPPARPGTPIRSR